MTPIINSAHCDPRSGVLDHEKCHGSWTGGFSHRTYTCGCPCHKPDDQVLIGSQPQPVPNESQPVQDLIVEYIGRRRELGVIKYGTPLQTHNGRDAIVDAFEEAFDLVMYLGQYIIERDGQLPPVLDPNTGDPIT